MSIASKNNQDSSLYKFEDHVKYLTNIFANHLRVEFKSYKYDKEIYTAAKEFVLNCIKVGTRARISKFVIHFLLDAIINEDFNRMQYVLSKLPKDKDGNIINFTETVKSVLKCATLNGKPDFVKYLLKTYPSAVTYIKDVVHFNNAEIIKELINYDTRHEIDIFEMFKDTFNKNISKCFGIVIDKANTCRWNAYMYGDTKQLTAFDDKIANTILHLMSVTPTSIEYLEKAYPNYFLSVKGGITFYEKMFDIMSNGLNKQMVLFLLTKISTCPDFMNNDEKYSKVYHLFERLGYNRKQIMMRFKDMFINMNIEFRACHACNFSYSCDDLIDILQNGTDYHSLSSVKIVFDNLRIPLSIQYWRLYPLLGHMLSETREDVKSMIAKLFNKLVKTRHLPGMFRLACRFNNKTVADYILKIFNKNKVKGVILQYAYDEQTKVIYEYVIFDSKNSKNNVKVNKPVDTFGSEYDCATGKINFFIKN